MEETNVIEYKPIEDINNKPEFEPIEDLFEQAKEGMLLIIESNIEVAKRVDNLGSLREYAQRFYGRWYEDLVPRERIAKAKHLVDISVKAYEEVYERTKEFELEEFRKEDMKDYYDNIVPSIDSVETDDDLVEALVVFNCVQPYGSKMNQLHQLVLEEIEKRAMYED